MSIRVTIKIYLVCSSNRSPNTRLNFCELGVDTKYATPYRYQKKAAKLTQEYVASANEVEYL